jgi:hypothetical protein
VLDVMLNFFPCVLSAQQKDLIKQILIEDHYSRGSDGYGGGNGDGDAEVEVAAAAAADTHTARFTFFDLGNYLATRLLRQLVGYFELVLTSYE